MLANVSAVMSSPTSLPPDSEAWVSQFDASLRQQCDHVRESLLLQQTRWEESEATLRRQIQQLIQELETQQFEAAQQLRDLETQLAAAQSHLPTGEGNAVTDAAANDDFHRRYELALDDIRELKAKNSELQQQATQLRSATVSTVGRSVAGVLDWESEKARILAVLECETDPSAERHSERIKVEDVIRATDQVLAEKDREIEELKKQLTEQPRVHVEPVVAEAQLVQSILDKDAIIAEERAKLQRTQQDWHDKLRQAEIELSLERARLARQQADMETKFRQGNSESSVAPANQDKPARGKWLARLGLVEADMRRPPPTPS